MGKNALKSTQLLLALAASLLVRTAFAQDAKPVVLQFSPLLQSAPLVLDTGQAPPDQVAIATFKCYITNVQLLRNGKPVWSEAQSAHLLNAAHPASLAIALRAPNDLQFDAVQFNLGTDSLTNVSGAFGGDLDPTKGMYWTWHSGYINLKLEGRHPQHGQFQFHLGGYAAPHQTVQTVVLPADNNRVEVAIELGTLLDAVSIEKQVTVMRPCAEAVRLARVAATIFYARWAE